MAMDQSAKISDQNTTCKRCHEEAATYQIRSEQVCNKCFIYYVTTKAIKRMETYRIRPSLAKSPRKLLLALSYGPCSATLLHILDQHTQGQINHMKRAAYQLHVVHVNLFLDSADRKEASDLLEKYKMRFPRHTYSSVDLEDALLLDGIDWKALNLEHAVGTDSEKPPSEKLQELLGLMSSATSRSDVASTLLTQLLVDAAKKNNCEAILFGDSTTRLAEKTLTETAKGRGFSLPWQVSDGASPYGLAFNHPLRDVLKKEIVTFSSLPMPPLTELIIYQKPSSHVSASSKSTTIDELMAQYFKSVEENYPSIVANVVRTASKLQSLTGDDTTGCGLCGLPVSKGADGIHGWGGDQNADTKPLGGNATAGIICYGCARSVNS